MRYSAAKAYCLDFQRGPDGPHARRRSWARCATWRDIDSKMLFLAAERVIHGRFSFVRGNDSGTFSPVYESARGLCEKRRYNSAVAVIKAGHQLRRTYPKHPLATQGDGFRPRRRIPRR